MIEKVVGGTTAAKEVGGPIIQTLLLAADITGSFAMY